MLTATPRVGGRPFDPLPIRFYFDPYPRQYWNLYLPTMPTVYANQTYPKESFLHHHYVPFQSEIPVFVFYCNDVMEGGEKID